MSKVSLKKINLIAVTYKPGLVGALMIGLGFAKALALAIKKPESAWHCQVIFTLYQLLY
ncbi:MAG: hypothetical protein EOM78_14515, partial [Erysipelotrichia bacterium]|nr:hypothetical protein [Erysipelotrichia bacterium]